MKMHSEKATPNLRERPSESLAAWQRNVSNNTYRPKEMQLRLLPSKLQGMRATFLAQADPHPEWPRYLKR